MKTKNIFRALLLMLAANCFALTSQAQSALCPGDSICLDAGSFRGTIQWQSSTDGVAFSDINGATTSPYCEFPAPGNFWYRGFIVEGSCDTLWTDTLQAIISSPVIAVTPTNPWIVSNSCSDTLFTDMTVSGGTGSYTYDWSPSSQLNDPSVQFPVIIATTPGQQNYTLTVTDSLGCVSVISGLMVDFQGTVTFNFTGGIQTLTTEACYDSVFIQTWGGQGGSGATGGNSATGGAGGLGGYAEGWYVAAPATVMNVFVGGQGATPSGGFNGGANGGSTNAGGGGGASDVRVGGTAEVNRIITAGGGGGGGRAGCETNTVAGGAGGAGGGGVGANGTDAPTSGGVAGGGQGGNFGGTQGLNGGAGSGCGGFLGAPGATASTGTGGSGGAGQSCCCFSFGSIPGGGGGGGGFLGGGGAGGGSAGTTGCSGNDKGAGGGGGGGSSNTAGVINGVTTSGIWLGNGMVTISW